MAVVDGAWDPHGIVAYAERHGLRVVAYIATHYHYDHIGGAREPGSPRIPGLREFVDEMGVRAYVHQIERDTAIRQCGVRNTTQALLPSVH